MEVLHLIISGNHKTQCLEVEPSCTLHQFTQQIASNFEIPECCFSVVSKSGLVSISASQCDGLVGNVFSNDEEYTLIQHIHGGIDFQHREGSKVGSGGMLSESQAAIERKERLRKLALETIDITKDPYFFKNHLGSFECKLCFTLHPNEGNYLAHTQGKRHQSNLGRRAAMEAKSTAPKLAEKKEVVVKRVIKIGRPGYKVTKSRDMYTKQRSLTFEIDYPEAEEGIQPRHRFMSSYEQKVEAPDKNFQYLLFACDPYETIGFKIPNNAIDKSEGRFFTNWDAANKKFVLQLYFLEKSNNA